MVLGAMLVVRAHGCYRTALLSILIGPMSPHVAPEIRYMSELIVFTFFSSFAHVTRCYMGFQNFLVGVTQCLNSVFWEGEGNRRLVAYKGFEHDETYGLNEVLAARQPQCIIAVSTWMKIRMRGITI